MGEVEKEESMVNHPKHYKTESGIETIEVIEAFTADLVGIEAVDTSQVIKYICRWKKKNGVQDLEKANWYLTHLINHVKSKQEEEIKENKLSKEEIKKRLEELYNYVEENTNEEGYYGGRRQEELYNEIGWLEIALENSTEEDVLYKAEQCMTD